VLVVPVDVPALLDGLVVVVEPAEPVVPELEMPLHGTTVADVVDEPF
jgi:hypothetical protein